MSFLKAINNSLPVQNRYQPLFDRASRMIDPAFINGNLMRIGEGFALYPADNGQRYIQKGYNLNDAVYSIVSKNAEKAGQIRFYHSRVKKNEQKTLAEYNHLAKGTIGTRELKEMSIMRKAMVEDLVVDSDLSRLLNKPNRYQTQSEFIEQLFGFRELQGEGNLWFNRGGNEGARPEEMFIIPRQHLNLRVNREDPWGLIGYQFAINGGTVNWPLEDVIMWKYSNYNFDATTYEHLRGLAPLQAAMVLLQSMNEGDTRLAISNANGGAAGLAFRKDELALRNEPSAEQKTEMRRQFNEIVNNSEMAKKIAFLGGDWGYHNLAVSVEAQKILEQYDYGFERLCRVFKTDYGIFESDAKYENKQRSERHWIYSKIAPNIYNLRGLLSDRLLPEFGLSPERDLIDCDIMSLPELTEEMKELTAALKDVDCLSENEKRSYLGYEPKKNPLCDLTPLELGEQISGGNLDAEEEELNS